jgi:hypothetical protein
MKELWNVIVEKTKEADKDVVLLWAGVMGIVSLLLTTMVIIKFFKMVVSIVQLVTAVNPGTPSY